MIYLDAINSFDDTHFTVAIKLVEFCALSYIRVEFIVPTLERGLLEIPLCEIKCTHKPSYSIRVSSILLRRTL